ncbi:hypothetical protein C1N83_23965 [Priestia aryabhattai]
MGTRVSYPVEVKLKAIEMRLAGIPVKEVMETLQIRNRTQLKTWMRWQKNEQREEMKRKKRIERKIGEQCRNHKFRYGYRKITALLNQTMRINHKTVQRVMQKYSWQCRVKRKKRKQTGQPYQVVENVLNRNFRAERPLQKLVTDIT